MSNSDHYRVVCGMCGAIITSDDDDFAPNPDVEPIEFEEFERGIPGAGLVAIIWVIVTLLAIARIVAN